MQTITNCTITIMNEQIILEGKIPTNVQSFVEKAGINKSLVNKKPLVVEFILPFNKETLANAEEQAKLFSETVSAIRKELPLLQKTTIQ